MLIARTNVGIGQFLRRVIDELHAKLHFHAAEFIKFTCTSQVQIETLAIVFNDKFQRLFGDDRIFRFLYWLAPHLIISKEILGNNYFTKIERKLGEYEKRKLGQGPMIQKLALLNCEKNEFSEIVSFISHTVVE